MANKTQQDLLIISSLSSSITTIN